MFTQCHKKFMKTKNTIFIRHYGKKAETLTIQKIKLYTCMVIKLNSGKPLGQKNMLRQIKIQQTEVYGI